MTFLQPRNRRAHLSRRGKIFLAVFLFVGVLASAHLALPKGLSGYAHSVARPLWETGGGGALFAADKLSLLHSKRDLVLENRMLREEIERLREETKTALFLKKQNDELMELFGRTERAERTLAAVITRPDASPYDTFVIDVGARQGIRSGDYAAAPGGSIIGAVSAVFNNTAIVTLFSSPGTKTPVLVGPANIQVAAEGRGGGNFKAFLPHDADVSEGDSVRIPGTEPLLFGVVEKVVENPTDPFKTILFKNPVNMHETAWVEIISLEHYDDATQS